MIDVRHRTGQVPLRRALRWLFTRSPYDLHSFFTAQPLMPCMILYRGSGRSALRTAPRAWFGSRDPLGIKRGLHDGLCHPDRGPDLRYAVMAFLANGKVIDPVVIPIFMGDRGIHQRVRRGDCALPEHQPCARRRAVGVCRTRHGRHHRPGHGCSASRRHTRGCQRRDICCQPIGDRKVRQSYCNGAVDSEEELQIHCITQTHWTLMCLMALEVHPAGSTA